MHAELATRRRVLLLTYQRYQEADQAWKIALHEMKIWFPKASQPNSSAIGNPGSPVRRLYEQRERAMLQIEVAKLKLDSAKKRIAERRRRVTAPRVLLITHFEKSL